MAASCWPSIDAALAATRSVLASPTCVGEALLFNDGGAQGLERAFSVAHAEIESAQRRQLDGAFGFLADLRVELECLGVQRQRAIEITEGDQSETVVAQQRGVLIGLGLRIDERQQRLVFLRGLRNEAAKVVHGGEIAQ